MIHLSQRRHRWPNSLRWQGHITTNIANHANSASHANQPSKTNSTCILHVPDLCTKSLCIIWGGFPAVGERGQNDKTNNWTMQHAFNTNLRQSYSRGGLQHTKRGSIILQNTMRVPLWLTAATVRTKKKHSRGHAESASMHMER